MQRSDGIFDIKGSGRESGIGSWFERIWVAFFFPLPVSSLTLPLSVPSLRLWRCLSDWLWSLRNTEAVLLRQLSLKSCKTWLPHWKQLFKGFKHISPPFFTISSSGKTEDGFEEHWEDWSDKRNCLLKLGFFFLPWLLFLESAINFRCFLVVGR